MEYEKYSSQIDADLTYFKYIHHRLPEKIFMSYPLWMVLRDGRDEQVVEELLAYSYHDVPVKVYLSEGLEYYFASSGFVF